MKVCSVCLKELPLNRFPKNKDTRKTLGYTIKSNCYECHANKNRLWYYDNYELMREYDRNYRKAKKGLKVYRHKYYKLFTSPTYKREDVRPRVDFSTASPSPEEWQEAAEQSQKRILARHK